MHTGSVLSFGSSFYSVISGSIKHTRAKLSPEAYN